MEKVAEPEVTIQQDDRKASLYDLILKAKAGGEEAKDDLLNHPDLSRRCSVIAAVTLNANSWAKDYIPSVLERI